MAETMKRMSGSFVFLSGVGTHTTTASTLHLGVIVERKTGSGEFRYQRQSDVPDTDDDDVRLFRSDLGQKIGHFPCPAFKGSAVSHRSRILMQTGVEQQLLVATLGVGRASARLRLIAPAAGLLADS